MTKKTISLVLGSGGARDACGTLEFDRADEMITLGYEAATRTLGSL